MAELRFSLIGFQKALCLYSCLKMTSSSFLLVDVIEMVIGERSLM